MVQGERERERILAMLLIHVWQWWTLSMKRCQDDVMTRLVHLLLSC
jgi:hypothetical protein